MKTYVKPMMESEVFMANEYVAACWGVSCEVDAANTVEKYWMLKPWESNYDNGQTHDSAHCGMMTNQWVIDDNNDGIVDRMVETGTDGLGDLACNLFTDDTYKINASFSGIQTGSYIYWTTSSGKRTWHHQGSVVGVDSNHPNRS